MITSPKKILFISHDASRTGAPIVLLNQIKWLKENANITAYIILKNNGELRSDFESIGKTYLWRKKLKNPIFAIINKILEKCLNFEIYSLITLIKIKFNTFDTIYVNSSASIDILFSLKKHIKAPTICHIHELNYGIHHHCGNTLLKKADAYIDHYIAVSNCVTQYLIDNFFIKRSKVTTIYGFVPLPSQIIKHLDPYAKKLKLIKKQKKAIVVGGCGTLDWRKGPDLFIQLIKRTTTRYPDSKIIFCWIGGNKKSNEYHQLMYDISKLNLCDYVFFPGATEHPEHYYPLFDLFLLTSREDPFPLVCLEAAAHGLPILCFENAGGMPEFVAEDAGCVVPYMDLDKMTDTIYNLMNSKNLRQWLGSNAQQKVLKNHNISTNAPRILDIINKFS